MVFQDPNNITNLTALIHHANAAAEGWLGISIVFMFVVIAFFISKEGASPADAFTVAMVTGLIMSTLLGVIGLVTGYVVFVFVAGVFVSYIWLRKQEPTF